MRLLVRTCLVILPLLLSVKVGFASSWNQLFSGAPVTLVAANYQYPEEIAAVVNGKLKLSHDGGLVWLDSLAASPRRLSFDPARKGRLYIGTDKGLFASSDAGMSWQTFAPSVKGNILGLKATSGYIYATSSDGAGTPVRLYRIDRDGAPTELPYPTINATDFDYDEGRRKLFLGGYGGVYISDDEGKSWRGGRGSGQVTTRVIYQNGSLWQLCADGLFKSTDDGATWSLMARPGDLNRTFYGNDMRLQGLASVGTHLFYGAWSFNFPYKFLVDFENGTASSVLALKVNDVSAAGGTVWAASDTGLWMTRLPESRQPIIRRPVLIIPGIGGSLPTRQSISDYFASAWNSTPAVPMALDPIFHTYDGLISDLVGAGYVKNKSLFLFPYDWTEDNATTAGKLAMRLKLIRSQCQCPKVDIVAHSMGNLVARSYIQGDDYAGDVGSLIQIGPVNGGALDAYPAWEGGQFDSFKPQAHSLVTRLVVSALAESLQTESVVRFIHEKVVSVRQLLPVFSYIQGRAYPENYPVNDYLSRLNGGVEQLRSRVSLYSVGSDAHATESQFVVGPPSKGLLWINGKVLSTNYSTGDGTVLTSSQAVVNPLTFELPQNHNELVGASSAFVIRTLTGGEFDPGKGAPTEDRLLIYARSAESLKVEDVEGKDPAYYYSGVGVSPQIMAISRPHGSYTITTSGSHIDLGIFKIRADGTATGPIELPSYATSDQAHFTYSTDSGALLETDPRSESVADNHTESKILQSAAVEPLGSFADEEKNLIGYNITTSPRINPKLSTKESPKVAHHLAYFRIA